VTVDDVSGSLLAFRGVTKRYGPRVAVEDVDLDVREGRTLGIGRVGFGEDHVRSPRARARATHERFALFREPRTREAMARCARSGGASASCSRTLRLARPAHAGRRRRGRTAPDPRVPRVERLRRVGLLASVGLLTPRWTVTVAVLGRAATHRDRPRFSLTLRCCSATSPRRAWTSRCRRRS
jgi:hypothetical protein